MFKASSLGDTMWVCPLLVFWHVVVQEPVMSKKAWKVEALPFHSRDASPSELAKLHNKLYLPTSTTWEKMVPLQDMAACLDELSLRYLCLEATVRSMLDIHANSPADVLAHSSTVGGFVQPQPCPLTQAQVNDVFSLKSEYPEYFEDGTELMAQYAAGCDFFENPPVGSGLPRPIQPQTIGIWWETVQRYLGYVKKYVGLEPSLVHLRDTALLAQYFSFKQARLNGWSTLKLEFTNLGNWFPFVFMPGKCPGLPAVPESVWGSTKRWMKDIKARCRAEAAIPENRKRKHPDVHLGRVWEVQEQEWRGIEAEFEVSSGGLHV